MSGRGVWAVVPWCTSIGVTLAFAIGIVLLWVIELESADPSSATPVVDAAAVDRFIDEAARRSGRAVGPRPPVIEVGLEIASIVFPGPHDAIITGHLWQLYGDDAPAELTQGVDFPDAVPSAADTLRQAWRVETARGQVVGWYFRVTLNQPFDYSKFPIDERRLVLRIRHVDPTEDVVLIPNFGAYRAMFPALLPGLRERVEIPGWRVEASLFTLATAERRTGFGLPGFAGEGEVPELAFEVRMTRAFTNAFVSNLLPLMIVAALLFGVLMTASLERERAKPRGFTTSSAYSTNAALLFVALVGHLRTREEVSAPQILYLEYFYFVAYFMIFAVSFVAFVTATPGPHPRWIAHGDVLVPKLVYWPLSFALFFAITALAFY